MTEQLIETLARGIAHGEYSLLLGAGASLGSVGGNGKPLPSGRQLRDWLLANFGLETGGEDISLARAYAEAERRDSTFLRNSLHEWFTGCSHTWQDAVADFTWHRIWTLNIDDVLENALKGQGRPYRTFGWQERFADRALDKKQQIIHLHGIASQFPADSETSASHSVIFSLKDYAQTVANPRSWHRVFFDEFAERPFLIIGTRLVEEFDLNSAISGGTVAHLQYGFPSVIVLPKFTDFQKAELTRLGLQFIEYDAETFVKALRQKYRQVVADLRNVYGDAVTPQAARFLQQFVDVRNYEARTSPGTGTYNFYAGHKPRWETILADDDARLSTTTRVATEVWASIHSGDPSQHVHLVHGEPGSGKSTALLRIAREIISSGGHPFLFRAEQDFDVDAAVTWLKNLPRSALLFDDVADFAGSIQELAETCNKGNVRLSVIATERTSRLKMVQDRIAARFLVSADKCGFLTPQDVDVLIDKLHSRGRLGRITRRSREEQRQYFLDASNRRLFEAMAGLEGGLGFEEVIRSDYKNIPNDNLRLVYEATAIAYELGVPLPTGIAADIGGVRSGELAELIDDCGRDILILRLNGIRTTHRVRASILVERVLGSEERFHISLSLAKALAPHLDIQSIGAITRPYRLARRLMDQDTVVRHVGAGRASAWYESLRDEFDWNGRYWEQRALLESRLGNHPTARSYAERSVAIHAHPFAYNTLGTILFRIAEDSGDTRVLVAAVENLDRAKEFGQWNPSEHPYVTFFSHLSRFASKWGLESIPDRTRSKWNVWMRDAENLPLFSHETSDRNLMEWQRDWLLLATR